MSEGTTTTLAAVLLGIGITIFLFMGGRYAFPRLVTYFSGKTYVPPAMNPEQQLSRSRTTTTISIIGIISIIVGVILFRKAIKM